MSVETDMHLDPETLELYELAALESAERATAEAHLAGCETCREGLSAARVRLATLAAVAPQMEPPAWVRQRLMEAVQSAGPASPISSVSPARSESPLHPAPPARRMYWGWSWSWGPVAAALAVALAVAVGRQQGLQARNQTLIAQVNQAQGQVQTALQQTARLRTATAIMAAPGTQAVSMTTNPAQPKGRAYINPQQGAVLIATNLPPAPARHTYEMWILPVKGNPRPAGVFDSDASGNAVVVFREAELDAAGLAVSIEPAGGSPQPTGAIVMAAKLAAR